MTIDVITTATSGDINNGSAIVSVNRFGSYSKLDAGNDNINTSNLELKYTNRFVKEDGFLPPSQYQWEDMKILPSTFDFVGVGDPTLVAWQPGGSGATFRIWEFAQDDEGFFTVQLSHGYVEGTDLYPHVHWTPKDNGVSESGNTVDWKMDYSIANVNDTYGPSTTVSLKDTCSGENDKHEIIGSSPKINGSGIKISAMLIGRIYRGTDDTWTGSTSTNLPCLLELDIHYQLNSIGSRDERQK